MKNLKIVFFGTPDFVNPVLATLKKNFELVGIINSSNNLSLDELKNLNPDLFIVAAFGKLIPKEILDIPKYGSLNIHPSLLPRYRGPSPIQQALLNGDKVSGITITVMDEEIDHGPIIYQEEFEISDMDTFDNLSKSMFSRSAEILPQVIADLLSGKIKSKLQDDAIATYCNHLKKQDGYFDINSPPSSEKLDRMIRAYFPWPTVWTKWSFDGVYPEQSRGAQDKKVKIVKFLPGGLVQMEGKKPTPLKDFLNGYPDFPIKSI